MPTSFTNEPKSASTFNNETRGASSWANEDGHLIVPAKFGIAKFGRSKFGVASIWTNETKN